MLCYVMQDLARPSPEHNSTRTTDNQLQPSHAAKHQTSARRSSSLASQRKTLAAAGLWRRHISIDGTDGRTDTTRTQTLTARSGQRQKLVKQELKPNQRAASNVT